MPSSPQNLIKDCAANLALTVGELSSIAKTAPKRYYVWEIEKRSGNGMRTLCQPARELKAIQYYLLDNVLSVLPVHKSATAYVAESSIKKNAYAHSRSRVVMKLDFLNFFNSIKVADWKRFAHEHFPHWSQEELEFTCRALFWGQGTYNPKCLAIGAPSSPLVSNALLYDVDKELADYAQSAELIYTRYADDITFSSQGFLNYDEVLKKVKSSLRGATCKNISLNEEKTILVSKGDMRRVTGLIITPEGKISLGRNRKRLISSMVHHASQRTLPSDEWPKLAGLLAFVADVEPDFLQTLRSKYTSRLINRIMLGQTN